jgi:predicted phage-related endonuclease
MYKIIDYPQRTDEWLQARLGKWTASFFDKAITSTGKRSASADEVNNRLVAELIIGRPDETFQSEAMLRGSELEDEALKFINFTHDYNFKPVGFMDSELGFGCSIDGNDVENDIGLEMKIPSLHTHLEYLAGGCLPKKYKAQVQGAMMVTGRKQHVFMSYHPEIKPFVVVVDRDDEFIKEMKKIILDCCIEVQTKLKNVQEILNEKEAG